MRDEAIPTPMPGSAKDTAPALLCYDGSEDAKRALAQAGTLLGGGPAVVVHVWEPLSAAILKNPLLDSPGPLAEQAAELDAAGSDAARKLAAQGAKEARAHGFDAEARCIRGNDGVWPAIVALADQLEARAVVLGPRGLSAVGSALLGSVSTGVLHHCGRCVIVIPPADRRDHVDTRGT